LILVKNKMQNLPNIKNQLSRKDLFDSFRIQLAKDFEQSSFSADFIEALEPNYTIIHEKIALELERIDISEVQLKKYLNEYKNENYFNVIAELIIKRVLQKVVIKQRYKNHKNSEGAQSD